MSQQHAHDTAEPHRHQQWDDLVTRLRNIGYALDAAQVLLSPRSTDAGSFPRAVGAIEQAESDLAEVRADLEAQGAQIDFDVERVTLEPAAEPLHDGQPRGRRAEAARRPA